MALLENVIVNWASVHTPNTQFEPAWEVQATFNSVAQMEEFVEASKKVDPKGKGIKVKQDDQGNNIFRFKRRVARADGNGENSAPLVCGIGGPTDKFDKLIGNGSTCTIQYAFSAYDNKFGRGVTSDLKGVMVINHIPFGVQDGEEFEGLAKPKPEAKVVDNEYNDEDFN
jgi:hypothetical protein